MDRLLNQYEEIVRTQQAINGQLSLLIVIMSVGAALAFVLFLMEAIGIVGRRAFRAEVMRLMRDHKAQDEEVWRLLVIVKEWASTARVQAKESQLAVKKVAEEAKLMPESEKHVIDAVEQVPEKTARVVVDKLDELKRLLVPPAVLAGALAGSTFAAGPASAADELRAKNAAIALEWAARPGDSQQ